MDTSPSLERTPISPVALVTGAAAGIGRAVAEALAAAGWAVGALDAQPLEAPAGGEALRADVTDEDAVREAVDGFGRRHGRLNLLVGNAGISCVGTVEETNDAAWARLFDVNVFAQARVVRAALPWLRQAETSRASIVLMGSCSASNGIPRRAAYSASKGAVHALARTLAVDLLGDGIRVNCVEPGTVDTPFVRRFIEEANDPAAKERALHRRQPAGRMVSPAEVAAAVLYLAGATSTTGETLVIDGGMRTLRPAPVEDV